MQSGFIKDAALSSGYDQGNPEDSRLGKKVERSGGWLASPYVSEDYLQIDLAVLYSLTAIAVEGQYRESGLPSSFVRKYTVMISNDSLVWLDYSENGTLKVSVIVRHFRSLLSFSQSTVRRELNLFDRYLMDRSRP